MILSVVRGNLSPRVLAESKGTVAFRLVPLRGEVSESVPRPQTVSMKSVKLPRPQTVSMKSVKLPRPETVSLKSVNLPRPETVSLKSVIVL